MTPADIKCRCCGNTYNVPQGCTFCEDAKRHIVWPDPTEGSSDTSVSVAKQMMAILRDQLDRLQKEIKDLKHSNFSPQIAKEAKQLASAFSLVVKETRQLEAQAKKAAESMGWDEKAQLVLEMFASAPPEFKKAVLEGALAQMEAEQAPTAVFGDEPN